MSDFFENEAEESGSELSSAGSGSLSGSEDEDRPRKKKIKEKKKKSKKARISDDDDEEEEEEGMDLLRRFFDDRTFIDSTGCFLLSKTIRHRNRFISSGFEDVQQFLYKN